MRFPLLFLAVCWLLTACESRPGVGATPPSAPTPVAAAATPLAPPATPRSDTTDYARSYRTDFTSQHQDTLVRLGNHQYWLSMSQVADSTKPLDYAPAVLVGPAFAAPSDTAWRAHRIRGYDGSYKFILRDSARQRVLFSRQLRKKDLAAAGPAELVTVSEPYFDYRGYSSGLHALLFNLEIGVPSSDVGYRAALLLDAHTGRVQGLYPIGSSTFEATDCDPQVAPDGQTVLTCTNELLRAGRPPFSLKRPHAELLAARFLTDSTLLVAYQFGDYRPAKREPVLTGPAFAPTPVGAAPITAPLTQPEMEFTSSPAQRRLPNAFIMNTNGRQLAAFHYDGWQFEISYTMPRHYLPATRTYYLLNGEVDKPQSLMLLPRAHPDSVIQLPLKSLPKYQAPRRPQEVIFTLETGVQMFTFYVDTLQPRRIRYRVQANGGG